MLYHKNKSAPVTLETVNELADWYFLEQKQNLLLLAVIPLSYNSLQYFWQGNKRNKKYKSENNYLIELYKFNKTS